MQKKGFTLTEIVVALIIISLTLAGILATFVAGKRHTRHVIYRLKAQNLARQKLEILKNEVRQDTWDNQTSALYPGHNESENITDGLITYQRNYSVSSVPEQEYRKVIVNVTWSEND